MAKRKSAPEAEPESTEPATPGEPTPHPAIGRMVVYTVAPEDISRLLPRNSVGDSIECRITRVEATECDVEAPGFSKARVRLAFEASRGCVHFADES